MGPRHWCHVVIVLGMLTAPAVGASPDEHLLAGASAFRTGDYEKALIEFKVARQLGADPDSLWYIAATLVNLQRIDEALETFARAREKSPASQDALLNYYEAVACYSARLYHCAQERLDQVNAQAGPRISEEAQKLRARVAPVLQIEPTRENLDWYHTKAKSLWTAGNKALGWYFVRELDALSQARKDCYRCTEARAWLKENVRP